MTASICLTPIAALVVFAHLIVIRAAWTNWHRSPEPEEGHARLVIRASSPMREVSVRWIPAGGEEVFDRATTILITQGLSLFNQCNYESDTNHHQSPAPADKNKMARSLPARLEGPTIPPSQTRSKRCGIPRGFLAATALFWFASSRREACVGECRRRTRRSPNA